MNRPLRLAHRGDWRRAPENSLPALLAAVAIPACDGLEFDVRAARDGTPILLHDPTLERVQGLAGRADELGPDELRDVGVPTLAEVLAAVPRVAFLDVELKDDPGPGVVDVLEVGRGAALENAVVSSFEPATIAGIRAARPDWPCWFNAEDLSEETFRRAVDLGCRGLSVDWAVIDGRAMERARGLGLEVAAWTVRDAATLDRLAALGVVAVCVEGEALDGGGVEG